MANYYSLNEAIASGVTNMTTLRNNTLQDDGTDTVTGVSWFMFNAVALSTLSVSGNSWLGRSGDCININQRDCGLMSLYREEGTVNAVKFFKVRWDGRAAYNNSNDDCRQQYDVFFFDNGVIYLNFFDVPTVSCSGRNSLVCNSITVNFTVTAGVAMSLPSTSANI